MNLSWEPIHSAPRAVPILVWIPALDEAGAVFPVWPCIITEQDIGDGEIETIYDLPAFDEKHGLIYSINTFVPSHWRPMLGGPD